MSGLVIKLSPHERVLINGAVIQNGEKRGKISILSPDVKILRLKDAMHPQDTNTPLKKLIHIAQLALSGDDDFDSIKQRLYCGVSELIANFEEPEHKKILIRAVYHINKNEPYQTLKSLRSLLPAEADITGDTKWPSHH
jgi:flagellar protein FlbT